MDYFQDKVAVVTGGASGIGRALCAALVARGARVVVADIEQGALDRACTELGAAGGTVVGCKTDVTVKDSVSALADFTWQRFGGCDLLFSNAGIGLKEAQRRLWTLPEADWSWGMQVNLFGVVNGIRAFVPRMLADGRAGHLITTSSANGGLAPLPVTPIYAATKAAATAVTEVLNYQLQMDASKLSAHVLIPGPYVINTNILNSERNRPGAAPAAEGYRSMAELAEKSGLSTRLTEPSEVAEYCLRGVEKNQFWIVPESAPLDPRFERRVEHIRNLTRPVPGDFS